MIVKPFTEEDEAVFLTLCKQFYSSHATIKGFNEKTAKMTFERVIHKHENLWGFFMLDKETNEHIGYSLITSYWCNEEGGNVIVIDELYIAPVDRHKGYASKFMEWLQTNFSKSAVSMTLEVLTTNINACALYKKEGFEPDGFTTYSKTIV